MSRDTFTEWFDCMQSLEKLKSLSLAYFFRGNHISSLKMHGHAHGREVVCRVAC